MDTAHTHQKKPLSVVMYPHCQIHVAMGERALDSICAVCLAPEPNDKNRRNKTSAESLARTQM